VTFSKEDCTHVKRLLISNTADCAPIWFSKKILNILKGRLLWFKCGKISKDWFVESSIGHFEGTVLI
jgi:hypothetical protein